jgi:predicted alpha/beta hydrolase family esterase
MSTMLMDVVLLQGAGEGAHDADAELARSLQQHLGEGFRVEFPTMPREGDPDFDRWRPAIAAAVEGAEVLVGHSLGGYFLLKYLAANPSPTARFVGIIAAPFPNGDADWVFDGFELPEDFAAALPEHVVLYASEDDEVVPFAHRDLYAAAIPQSVTHTTTGGHQLGGDLSAVAADILASH